jgi:hypothetical protein
VNTGRWKILGYVIGLTKMLFNSEEKPVKSLKRGKTRSNMYFFVAIRNKNENKKTC